MRSGPTKETPLSPDPRNHPRATLTLAAILAAGTLSASLPVEKPEAPPIPTTATLDRGYEQLEASRTYRRPAPPAATLTPPAQAIHVQVTPPPPPPPPPPPSRVDVVIGYALAQVGDRYVWAAAGPNAFDCSGLVLAAYARVGIRLPHQSYAMLRYGRQVSRAQLRRGDLVWPQPGHVAIYLGDGRIVEAANRRSGVRIGRLYGFWTARRIL